MEGYHRISRGHTPRPGGAGLHRGHVGQGMSDSKTSSATTSRRDGSSPAVVHDSRVVLPDPGGPANTIDSRARTQAANRSATWAVNMSRSTSSPSDRNGIPSLLHTPAEPAVADSTVRSCASPDVRGLGDQPQRAPPAAGRVHDGRSFVTQLVKAACPEAHVSICTSADGPSTRAEPPFGAQPSGSSRRSSGAVFCVVGRRDGVPGAVGVRRESRLSPGSFAHAKSFKCGRPCW